jgi:hypothetical protein
MHTYAENTYNPVDMIALDRAAFKEISEVGATVPAHAPMARGPQHTGSPAHDKNDAGNTPKGKDKDSNPTSFARNHPAEDFGHPSALDAREVRREHRAAARIDRQHAAEDNALRDGVISDAERKGFKHLGTEVYDYAHQANDRAHDKLLGTIDTGYYESTADDNHNGDNDNHYTSLGELMKSQRFVLTDKDSAQDYLDYLKDHPSTDNDGTGSRSPIDRGLNSDYAKTLLNLAAGDSADEIQDQIDHYQDLIDSSKHSTGLGTSISGNYQERIADLKDQLAARNKGEKTVLEALGGKRDYLASLNVERNEYSSYRDQLEEAAKPLIDQYNSDEAKRKDDGGPIGNGNDEENDDMNFDDFVHYMAVSGRGDKGTHSSEEYDNWIDAQDDGSDAEQALQDLKGIYDAYWNAGDGDGLNEHIAAIDAQKDRIATSVLDDVSVLSESTIKNNKGNQDLINSINTIIDDKNWGKAVAMPVPDQSGPTVGGNGSPNNSNNDNSGATHNNTSGPTDRNGHPLNIDFDAAVPQADDKSHAPLHVYHDLSDEARAQLLDKFWQGVKSGKYRREDGEAIVRPNIWINRNFSQLNGGAIQYDQLNSDAQQAYLEMAKGKTDADRQKFISQNYDQVADSWYDDNYGATQEEITEQVQLSVQRNTDRLTKMVNYLEEAKSRGWGKPAELDSAIEDVQHRMMQVNYRAEHIGADGTGATDLSRYTIREMYSSAYEAVGLYGQYLPPTFLNELGIGKEAQQEYYQYAPQN